MMAKSGLFLLSIGCLLFVLSVNSQTGSYNLVKVIVGLILIVSGIIIVFKNKNQNKAG